MAEQFPTSKAPDNLTVEQLEADILNYIESWHNKPLEDDGHVQPGLPTFAVLQARYGKHGVGHVEMNLTSYSNVLLWQGLSQNLATAIANLCVRGDIHWHQSFLIHYMAQGRPLPLPLAKWPITEEYDRPHWLPVVFHPGPLCDRGDCPNRKQ